MWAIDLVEIRPWVETVGPRAAPASVMLMSNAGYVDD